MHVGGSRRNGPAAGDQTVKSVHHLPLSNPDSGDLHDLAGIDVEVAGLNVEGDEVIEVTLQTSRLKELQRLEQADRPPMAAIARPEHEIAGAGRLISCEPSSVRNSRPPQHGTQRDLQSPTGLHPDGRTGSNG